MTTLPKEWQIKKLAGALGAEITGPDISNVNEQDIDALEALLIEHLVIFLPDQSPTVQAHIDFGRHFGKLEGHPNLSGDSDLPPELFQLTASQGGVADEWHTDLTFQEQPALMSILHMMKCPETGGDTMWTSIYAV